MLKVGLRPISAIFPLNAHSVVPPSLMPIAFWSPSGDTRVDFMEKELPTVVFWQGLPQRAAVLRATGLQPAVQVLSR
jgi:hypothetical protein